MSSTPREEIVFYDVLSKRSRTWSPQTLKTRLVLNYKKLPYRTQFISYPHIASTLKSLGCPPNPAPAMKGMLYTVPAISHSSIPQAFPLQESIAIAEHLEKTFPTPSIFPGTAGKVLAVAVQTIISNIARPATIPIVIPGIPDILDDEGREYFIRTRTEWFGDLQEWGEKNTNWKQLETVVKQIETLLEKETEGPFMLGDTVSYADFIVAAWLGWIGQLPAENPGELLDKVLALGDGKLRRLWEATQQWF